MDARCVYDQTTYSEDGRAGQFNEHLQPPEGFDRIKQIFAGDANAAWYWLTVPNDALDGDPILNRLPVSSQGRSRRC